MGMYTRPLAYFLTWHTYGTWLHGRQDGSVDRLHNDYATPLLKPSPMREKRAIERMAHEPVIFTTKARTMIEGVIREHCAIRKWHVHALAVRTNHVHLVVNAGETRPEVVVTQLKQWGTRRLRDNGVLAADRPVWSRHASTRQLYKEPELHQAIRYAVEGQERMPV